MSKIGRKLGSQNKLTARSKEILFESLEGGLATLKMTIYGVSSNEEKIIHLKAFAKLLLTKGDEEIAQKTTNLIFEGLEEHFKKLKFYLPHIPNDKKANELRQWLKLLTPDKIEKVAKDFKDNNVKF